MKSSGFIYMKKILIIASKNLSMSGVPVVIMSIVRALHKEYCFDILIYDTHDNYFDKEFLSYGGKIFYFNKKRRKNLLKKIYYQFLTYNYRIRRFFRTKINLAEYDIIHSFDEERSYPIFLYAKKNNLKTILHINSADAAYPRNKGIFHLVEHCLQKKALRFCDCVLCVSEPVYKLWNYKNKGKLVLNCFDSEYLNQIIDKQTSDIVLCQIGTFSSRKNQLFSLQVVDILNKKKFHAILYLIGNEIENGYKNKINTFIDDKNLKNNVVFLPPDYDKKMLFSKTSFLLFPSLKESFGLVLLEAQASGIHCFASDTIPTDSDMGNVDFLELNATKWATAIEDYYFKNGNKRTEPKRKNIFSIETYSNRIKNIYES